MKKLLLTGVFVVLASTLLGMGCKGDSNTQAAAPSVGIPESEYDLFASLVRNIDKGQAEVERIRLTENRVALGKAEALLAKERETLNLLFTERFGVETVTRWTAMVHTADGTKAKLIASQTMGKELLGQFKALGAQGRCDQEGRIINLACQNITPPDEVVARIANCTKMQALALKNAGFKDSQFIHLSNLTELTTLDLSENPLSGDGIKNLGKMTKLVTLLLNNTRLSDAHVKQFEDLEHLKTIRVINIHETRLGPDSYKKITRLFRQADVKY
jgi:hypothetical protein